MGRLAPHLSYDLSETLTVTLASPWLLAPAGTGDMSIHWNADKGIPCSAIVATKAKLNRVHNHQA